MTSWRASSFGSCSRSLVHLALGNVALPPSDRLQGYFDRGVAHEVECLAAMRADGWVFMAASAIGPTDDEDQPFVSLEVAGATVTGHLDGLGVPDWPNGPLRVIEIKSPISWAKWERAHKTGDYSDPLMHRYAWQASVYMVATGLEAVVACVEDGSVRTFGIETPPYDLAAITARVEFLEASVASGGLSECDTDQEWGCPTRYLHGKAEVVEDEALDVLFRDYTRWKAERDWADAAMKSTRVAIDAHLGLHDTLTTSAGTATRVPASMVTDWKATAEKLAKMLDLGLDGLTVTKPRAGYVNVTPRKDDAE